MDTGKSRNAGAPQHAQQKRFPLVVLVVRGQQALARLHKLLQSGIARAPSGGLHALAAELHVYLPALEAEAEILGHCLAMPGPDAGAALQIVVHMRNPQDLSAGLAEQLMQGQQQRRGITAAAERHQQPVIPPAGAQAAQRRFDCAGQRVDRSATALAG